MNNKIIWRNGDETICVNDIKTKLIELGIKEGDIVMAHFDTKMFGKIGEIKDKKEYYKTVINVFISVIGDEGALIIPSYTYSFCDGEIFDILNTKPKIGTLSEIAFEMYKNDANKEIIRSNDPIFSCIGFGKKAELILNDLKTECFGEESVFGRLYKYNAKLVCFGLDFAVTYMHYAEKHYKDEKELNYRYNKEFKGKSINNKGESIESSYTYFVRDLSIEYDFSVIPKFLEFKGLLNRVILGRGNITMINSYTLYKSIFEMLDKNKYYFIRQGGEMYNLMKELYSICRSITGEGVRKTLGILKKHISLEIHEVPSGTKVLDWTIPREWNINDAYIKNSKGEKIVDFKTSNLHVLNYSIPISKEVNLIELKEHLYTLPDEPDAIPYITSYYKDNWGFCISQNQYNKLKEDKYNIFIDSTLKDGNLTYGELFIKGKSKKEILLSTYICHPSLCNDNLSGVVILKELAKYLLSKELNYSYRLLFIPETIGSITWLSLNSKIVRNIKGGIVLTCLGDKGNINYKKSRKGNTKTDEIIKHILKESEEDYTINDFDPLGSDERQYCSPGFDLSVGCLMRSPPGKFLGYHNSKDTLELINSRCLQDSLNKCIDFVNIFEKDCVYIRLNPFGEPQLGKRGLYSNISKVGVVMNELAILWILSLADGKHSLLDISIKSKIKFEEVYNASKVLEENKLIKRYR